MFTADGHKANELLLSGVMLRDPHRFDLRGELTCGVDVEIDINVIIQGKVTLGKGVVIGANCLIGNYAFIRPGTIISNGLCHTLRICK